MKRAPLFAALVLAACASPSLPSAGRVTNASQSLSWMLSEAKNEDLLYVSDDAAGVYVYSYPAGKLVGMLTGFQGPAGLCSDSSGDVFIADTPSGILLEYRHGGQKPIWGVGAGGYPEGCAVDPSTGNFAITNYQTSEPSGPGSVVVYTNLRKRASTTYTDPSFNQFFFCGYDDKGNLFADGVNDGSSVGQFAELRHGGASLRNFTLDRTVKYPGGLQWQDGSIAVEDLSTAVLYRVKLQGSRGRVTGSVHLDGNHSTLLTQFWIQNGTIVLPYGKTTRTVHRLGFWPYPSGGSPEKILEPRGAVELVGATVSLHHPASP